MEVKEIETQVATSHAAEESGHYQPVEQFRVYTSGLPAYFMDVIGKNALGEPILELRGVTMAKLKTYESKKA